MEYILPDDNNKISVEEKGIIQNRILLSVYDDTYPVRNIDKAIEQIKYGIQKVLFWGNDLDGIKKSEGGTIALIKDLSKGDSCVEMCRAGSVLDNGGGIKAVRELYNYFLQNNENQLFATPRNCLERLNENGEKIPSGKTISKIYSRLENMQYWGIAPWYIMPGNTIELLDLFISTKKDYVKNRLLNGEKIYIFDDKYRDIFGTIIKKNYKLNNLEIVSSIDGGNIDKYLFELSYDENEKTSKYTYNLLRLSENGKSIKNIENDLNTLSSPINLVKLDLFDIKSIEVQEKISEKGYKMVSLFPEGTKLMGYWFKSENDNYALPYYYLEKLDRPLENKLIDIFLNQEKDF